MVTRVQPTPRPISDVLQNARIPFEQRVAVPATTGSGCIKHGGANHKCWHCHDLRWVGYGVGVNHPLFGRAIPCSECNH